MEKRFFSNGLKGTLMKNSSALLLAMFFVTSCSDTKDIFGSGNGEQNQNKGYVVANFESESMTPYFFRYGNNIGNSDRGQEIDLSYKPRWIYSHEVVNNPVKTDLNNSEKVLKYTSAEVRNFGIKIRFSESYSPGDIKNVQFKLYQPANVIGKDVWGNNQKATEQNVCVKLLSEYNSVCDFREDDGVLLNRGVQPFTEEGEWVTFKIDFSKQLYGSAAFNKLKNGICGIAIMPTYDSGTTLSEGNAYCCYIDDISFNVKE